MEFDEQARFDPSPPAGRTPRPSPALALGGGAGAVVVIVIALLFGVDPGGVLRGAPSAGPAAAACTAGPDVERDRNCQLLVVTGSLQEYWGRTRPDFPEVAVRTFEGRARTGCGPVNSPVGPFSCPADAAVYVDLGFVDQLRGRGGDAAQAYVLAHAFGHHVQHLTGVAQRVQSTGPGTGPRSPGVRLELQADCYAGVWFARAASDPDDGIAAVDQADLDQAVDAAAAVGGERHQLLAPGEPTPESWTHGSAAEQQRWLRRGFETGDPDRCDTFAADALR